MGFKLGFKLIQDSGIQIAETLLEGGTSLSAQHSWIALARQKMHCIHLLVCVSNARGSVGGFNDGGKNGRCTCRDVAGIQLELEEQARLLELRVAHTAKAAYSTRLTPRGDGFTDRR